VAVHGGLLRVQTPGNGAVVDLTEGVRSVVARSGVEAGAAVVFAVGATVGVDIFAPGGRVKVTGTTKGRGFQGVVKRHGFGGGPNTHGNTRHRKPGSVGPGTDPSRVIKGKRMPGHYGAERHTQTNLRVERVDADRNLIYVRGSIAGPKNGIVLVRKQG
jgi:large subunit ribosomal protein L3